MSAKELAQPRAVCRHPRDGANAYSLCFEVWLLRKLLERFGNPPLRVALWSGEELLTSTAPPVGRIVIRDRAALWRLFRDLLMVTSLSFRGDVITAICRHFGYACIQIPDHGGAQALELMKRAFLLSQIGGIAVDGPTGPYHVVKHGAIRIASDLGFKLMPVSVAARHKKVLVHRWDHMEIPWLFSRVCVVFGEPLAVSPGVTAANIAACTEHLHDAIVAVDHYAEERLAAR